MDKQLTYEELIIKMMPFSQQLIEWCQQHPEFQAALKIIYSDRFISLQAIVKWYSPYSPDDEVIGVYAYDYTQKTPLFKQDFIVNIGKLDNEFVLYTRNPSGKNSKYIKDISVFYKTYGKCEYYINSHHLTLDQLPEEIRERGSKAIQLAEKIRRLGGFVKPHQSQINKTHSDLISTPKESWFIKQKLKK
ncbi:MAG: hypothetical protein O2871_03635 [bacterium]|nr:hypothetical protein [bacterium]